LFILNKICFFLGKKIHKSLGHNEFVIVDRYNFERYVGVIHIGSLYNLSYILGHNEFVIIDHYNLERYVDVIHIVSLYNFASILVRFWVEKLAELTF